MPRKRKGVTAAQQRERLKRKQSSPMNDQLPCHKGQPALLRDAQKPDASKVISGTLHQGDTRFQNPGVQCAFISLLALIRMTIKDPQSWTSYDIDSCVIDGNSKFMKHCEALGIQPRMLMATELPKIIDLPKNSVACNQSESDIECGLLYPSMCDEDKCIANGIDKALVDGLNNSRSCLFF